MSACPKKKMKFSQNKAKYYSKQPNHHHQQYLAPGMQGFLATCNFREKDCVREAYNILNVAADELYGPEHSDKQVEETEKEAPNDIKNEAIDDIADQLQKEVNAVKVDNKKSVKRFQRFQRVETAANNCIFIRTTLDDPVKLATKIVEEIKTTQLQKTRFLLRLVPIETVCRVDEQEMLDAAGKLFDTHFLKEAASFSIVFNRRCNNDVKRDKIIAQFADLVASKNVANRVDLKNPEKTVVVEIVKGLCLLSVIPGYIQRKKFNLVELACGDKVDAAEKTNVEKAENDEANVENKPDEDKNEAKTDEKT